VGEQWTPGEAREWQKETNTTPIKAEELAKPKSYDTNLGGELSTIRSQLPSFRSKFSSVGSESSTI
jgi:hypothetical protein